MVAKMQGLRAQLLKIDFNYKIARKIKVYTGRGKSFSPFKCIATIQNEDTQTIWWGGIAGSESMSKLQPALRGIKERCQFLGSEIKGCYVDNCCNVRNKIVEVLGDNVFVKLDPFHWLKRWDAIMADSSCLEGGVARVLFSRALFNVPPAEYERARRELEAKLKRVPTNKEVLKETKASIPEPHLLRANVLATLEYMYQSDLALDFKKTRQERGESNDNGPLPKRFLKNMNTEVVCKTIRNQLQHVNNGCLSDPPQETINLFRVAPNGKVNVARGTSSNERDNLRIAQLLGTATVIGLHRAERLLWYHFEESNHRKAIIRLGLEDNGTYKLEQLHLIKSLAHKAGFSSDVLPYPNLPEPAEVTVEETIGFEYRLPQSLTEDASPLIDDDYVYVDDEATDDWLQTALMDTTDDGEVGLNDDIDLQLPEIEDDNITVTDTDPDNLQDDSMEDRADIQNATAIESLMQRTYTSLALPRESTLQCFKRLVNEEMWLPFNRTHPSEEEAEELRLFRQWETLFKRRADVNARDGYAVFASKWNNEVARRFKLRVEGDEDIILIRRKNVQFRNW